MIPFLWTPNIHPLASHCSVLPWRIPGMAEPGGLPSMGSHRVGHNWSDLAAAAAATFILGFWRKPSLTVTPSSWAGGSFWFPHSTMYHHCPHPSLSTSLKHTEGRWVFAEGMMCRTNTEGEREGRQHLQQGGPKKHEEKNSKSIRKRVTGQVCLKEGLWMPA